jgi:alpha-glucosidase
VQWWRDAVFYQVYVPSFTDSDGDGIGDLHGVRSRLGYLELLGVDALWLSPIHPSPMVDQGYDVTDHRAVEPTWGDLDALDALVADAHAHGIRVTIDLVPNHTSDRHAWFRAALASPPGSPERARYHFRRGRGEGGTQPPNDWLSVLGGPAWTREPPRDGAPDGDREFYLHLFSPAQPDLNWTNLEVWADLDKTLRFWLDRGIDGFRVDTAHGMCKRLDGGAAVRGPAAQGPPAQAPPARDPSTPDDPRFDVDEVHDVHRMIRATLDDYPQRVAVGAVAARTRERFARYVRADELHLAVDARLAAVRFDADELRATIEDTLDAVDAVGAAATWALSDHDVARPASRYGGGPVGLARARAMALVQLALPGAVYLYNGDELGLPDAEVPDDARRDAVGRPADHGRDGCRVPQPWDADLPAYGFTTGVPWLPLPDSYAALSAAAQLEDTGSTLSVYRRALELRRLHPGFAGGAAGPALEWFGAPDGCLAFRRAGTTLVCALNTSTEPVPLPPGDALLASGPLDDGLLPPDTAVWLA